MDFIMVENIVKDWRLGARIQNEAPQLSPPYSKGMLPILAAIRTLEKSGPVKVTDISDCLNVTSPGVIRIIGECEKLDLIKKKTDNIDSRISLILLTNEGQALLESTYDMYINKLAESFSNIPDDDWETLIKLMDYSYMISKKVSKDIKS